MNQIRDPKDSPEGANLLQRLHYSFGPILAGILLDFLDFVTFGPIGIYAGLFVGAGIGWWIGSLYGFTQRQKVLLAVVSGLYMMIPSTEFVPMATIVGGLARWMERDRQSQNTRKK